MTDVTVVVPTIGRPSLLVLLAALAAGRGPRARELLVVDDRPRPATAVPGGLDSEGLPPVRVLRSGGRGPAAARNVGWRSAKTTWVAFLDDDVRPDEGWWAGLADDLAAVGDDVVGSQGRLTVPLPADRRPTDWERSTAGLEGARWITADMAFRRTALSRVGGFDERFPRAYREDSDLALRLLDAGGRLVVGDRKVEHPVRPAPFWASVRVQAGNADDVLMQRRHGRHWRERAGAAQGLRRRHHAVVGLAVVAVTATASGKRRAGAVAATAWAAATAQFFWRRWAPGPRDAAETMRMAATSVALPFAAVAATARGVRLHRRAGPWVGPPELVLFDRDGTLAHDVAYNGDPARLVPVEGAEQALERLRSAGVRTGVITNQSGVARGLLTGDQVAAVNARLSTLLGPFDTVRVCEHGPADGCGCRKPAPGLVHQACADLGIDPRHCAVVGDIGADVGAAVAAGARAVLVPTTQTRAQEVREAPVTAPDLGAAVDWLLRGTI